MISAIIANFEIQKIMVDSGSASNILFYNAFERIKLPNEKLMIVQCPFRGFNGEPVMPEGFITLLITLGVKPKHLNLMIDFLVV